MLQPKRSKHRREFRRRGKEQGLDQRGSRIAFGQYGLKAQTPGEITSRQIEAARRAMTRYIKRGGKIWIRIFPHKIITRKASEVPMGSGKGSPEFHVALVRPGRIIFEMDGVEKDIAKEAMRLASHKLPIKCKFVTSEDI
jgi:large subunit ribosomal protein L16